MLGLLTLEEKGDLIAVCSVMKEMEAIEKDALLVWDAKKNMRSCKEVDKYKVFEGYKKKTEVFM